MAEPTLIQSKTVLPIDQIEVSDRLRPVSDVGVASIVASIREIGQLTNPIIVRQMRRHDGLIFRLLDGGHRLAAAGELGWTEIAVRVFECNDDQARLIEIDGNLAGAELNALDTAVFLAERKAVYERLHPETKAGFAGAFGRYAHATDIVSVAGFVQATAEKFGKSERHIYRMTAAAARLGPDEVRQLRLAERPVTLADLQVISAIGEPAERHEVVRMLATGETKGAAAARKAYMFRDNPPAPVDPVDAEYLALKDKWNRACKAARRRFINEVFAELSPLVVDEAEKRDAAEIADLRHATSQVAPK